LIFLTRPISCGFLMVAAFLLVSPLIFKRRPELGLE
jgi:TctA family transporter